MLAPGRPSSIAHILATQQHVLDILCPHTTSKSSLYPHLPRKDNTSYSLDYKVLCSLGNNLCHRRGHKICHYLDRLPLKLASHMCGSLVLKIRTCSKKYRKLARTVPSVKRHSTKAVTYKSM